MGWIEAQSIDLDYQTSALVILSYKLAIVS